MARVFQQKNGRWQAVVRKVGIPLQSKTFTQQKDAENWAKAIELDIDRGTWRDTGEAERTTLKDALDRYGREISSKKKSHESERYRIEAWCNHPLAKRSLASLKPIDFAKYIAERQSYNLSASSIRLELALISHLFTVANKRWGMPIANPVSGKAIDLPKVSNSRERRLMKDEESRLLAAFDAAERNAGNRTNRFIKPAVILAIETAMRQGELLALDWKHVDLKGQTVYLPDTKNGTARKVPLSTKAVAVFESLFHPKTDDKKIVGIQPKSGQVLKTSNLAIKQSWARALSRARDSYEREVIIDGLQANGLSDNEIRSELRLVIPSSGPKQTGINPKPQTLKLVEKLKGDPLLMDLTFHDLRHEATSRLAEKLEMHELMKVTGHKDTRMLARYYHPRAEDLAKKLG